MPNVTKFEYYVVEYEGKSAEIDTSRTCTEVAEWLNRLGQEGWELVAIDSFVYFFKRPAK